MKKITFFLVFTLIQGALFAQFTLSGIVSSTDKTSATGGTAVIINHSYRTVFCDDAGRFSIDRLQAGKYEVTFSNISFKTKKIKITLQNDSCLLITLDPEVLLANEVIISAISAERKTPITFSELSESDINAVDFGKDIPAMLNLLPSVVSTSDAGNSIGYTGLRIRGSDASRINVTVNGIPLNDAESQNVYWVDLPDLTSSLDNIQVQRGAGTSTNGAGSFGGSINMQTTKIKTLPYAEMVSSPGSFNTFKNNISIGSGLLNDHWFAEGRLSKITSDGYIDRASSDLKSFYASAGYAGKNTIARFNILSGKEITYQSWNGVPEARMYGDVAGMKAFIDRNYLSQADADNLLNSGRTYNTFTYKNQVDNYQQDHYQLLFAHQFNKDFLLNAALHYTKGKGYYEEFKVQDTLALYGLDTVFTVNDTIITSDLVRRKWLQNDFYGMTYSLNYAINNTNKIIIGGAWNQYDGDHFNELTWLQWTSGSHINERYYNDHALKTDFNIYLKYNLEVKNVNIYIDQQYRKVSFHFNGLNKFGSFVPQTDNLSFFNPKAGIYIKLSDSQSAYASVSVAHKEPSRDDYVGNNYAERPSAEQMTDYESGYHWTGNKASFQSNIYFMHYNNQLVLRGDLNDVGNATRLNVARSYRLGIELSGAYNISNNISVAGNITLSRNKIDKFTDHLDNYLDYSKVAFVYSNTDIAYSPFITGMANLKYKPFTDMEIALSGKHVGKQYLDNTQQESRKINDYTVFDLTLHYKIKCPVLKEVVFGVLLNNIFNTKYASNGYTYGYFYGKDEVHENFYYPQAGFNALGQVSIKF